MVIFFVILILFISSIILIKNSTFKVDIKELIIKNKEIEKFKIKISLNLFNKIKWISLGLDNNKMDEIRNGSKLKIFNKILGKRILKKYKNAGKILIKDWKNQLKTFNNIKLENVNILSEISTEDAASTAVIAGVISAILGIILAKKATDIYYKIDPVYLNKNNIYISITCIISIKLVHIININKSLGKEVYQ